MAGPGQELRHSTKTNTPNTHTPAQHKTTQSEDISSQGVKNDAGPCPQDDEDEKTVSSLIAPILSEACPRSLSSCSRLLLSSPPSLKVY